VLTLARKFARNKRLMDAVASPIQGWMELDELEWLQATASQMNTVVEIGSFKGRSTIALLNGCKGIVFSIDPWDGGDDVYAEYIYNTKEFQHLVICKMPSLRAATIFNAPVDMVFIDGNHAYGAVRNDIKAWLPKTKRLICGHDYDKTSPGVAQAVGELLGDVKLVRSIWYKEL
jgi:predicted O-methyltransferase YrrM